MTYATFLEQAFRAVREQAPSVTQIAELRPWLRSIGELLLGMPPDVQRYWHERYAILMVIKYHHIHPHIARVCVRHGLDEAEAQWPKMEVR